MNEAERMRYTLEPGKEAEELSKEILRIFQGKKISYAVACEALELAPA